MKTNPGYKHIIIQPTSGWGTHLCQCHTSESMYGEIVSGWKLEGITTDHGGGNSRQYHCHHSYSGRSFRNYYQWKLPGTILEWSIKEVDGKVLGKTGSGKYIIVTHL